MCQALCETTQSIILLNSRATSMRHNHYLCHNMKQFAHDLTVDLKTEGFLMSPLGNVSDFKTEKRFGSA